MKGLLGAGRQLKCVFEHGLDSLGPCDGVTPSDTSVAIQTDVAIYSMLPAVSKAVARLGRREGGGAPEGVRD